MGSTLEIERSGVVLRESNPADEAPKPGSELVNPGKWYLAVGTMRGFRKMSVNVILKALEGAETMKNGRNSPPPLCPIAAPPGTQ